MRYAVVKVKGKQYKVSEGDLLSVPAKIGEIDKKIEFDEVLLKVNDDKVEIGTPKIEAKVIGKVISFGKAKKVRIFTYKAKTGSHRTKGHRQDETKIQIEEIK